MNTYQLAQGAFTMPNPIQSPTGYGGGTGGADASLLISNIVAAIFATVGILFLLYLLFGAFKYLTAGGDDKAIQEAKKMLTNAGVGLGIAVAAFFITDILSQVLGFRTSIIGGITSVTFSGPGGSYFLDILNPTGYSTGVTGPGQQAAQPLGDLINNITSAIFVIGGILLLVYLLFGAFKYITAGGDDKATQSAKNMMTNAVVGILIMTVSFFIVRIAGTVLGMPDILNPVFPGP